MTTRQSADQWDVNVTRSGGRQTTSEVHGRGHALSSTRIEDPSHQFIFADAGLWAGSGRRKKRNFVVVYGNIVATCDFRSASHGTALDAAHIDALIRPVGTPIDSRELRPFLVFLNALNRNAQNGNHDQRVFIAKIMRYRGTHARNPTPDVIEVFLPDTHMPVLNGMPAEGTIEDGPTWGRFQYDGIDTQTARLGTQATDRKRHWFRRYAASDIFERAGIDLCTFLGRLHYYQQHRGENPAVRLVQVGDLLDLWIGFDCYFREVPWSRQVRNHRERVVFKQHGREFTRYWVRRALMEPSEAAREGVVGNSRANAVALKRFHRWRSALDINFLWGNHDCYFAQEAPRGLGGTRQFTYESDNLFSEHGHDQDQYNHDGNAGTFTGHWITTNLVFTAPWTRALEAGADLRADQLNWAARKFFRMQTLQHRTPYGIYVCGHTHLLGMGYCRVHGR